MSERSSEVRTKCLLDCGKIMRARTMAKHIEKDHKHKFGQYRCTVCNFQCGVSGHCIASHWKKANHKERKVPYIFDPLIQAVRDTEEHSQMCWNEKGKLFKQKINRSKAKVNLDFAGEVGNNFSNEQNFIVDTHEITIMPKMLESSTNASTRGGKRPRESLSNEKVSKKREVSEISDWEAAGPSRPDTSKKPKVSEQKQVSEKESDDEDEIVTLEDILTPATEKRISPVANEETVKDDESEEDEDDDYSDDENDDISYDVQEVGVNNEEGHAPLVEVPEERPNIERRNQEWDQNQRDIRRTSENPRNDRLRFDSDSLLEAFKIMHSRYSIQFMSDWIGEMLLQFTRNPNSTAGELIAELYHTDVKDEDETQTFKPTVKGLNANVDEVIECIVKNAEAFFVPTMYYVLGTNSMHSQVLGERIWKIIVERSAIWRAESSVKDRNEAMKELTVIKVLLDGFYITERGEMRY